MSVLSLQCAFRKTIVPMWQGSSSFPKGTVMDDKVDLSQSGTAVHQEPCVVERSYIKRNHANFYFLKNMPVFWICFKHQVCFATSSPDQFWPCHGNYLITSELFYTQGRELGRAGQSGVLNFALSSPTTSETYGCPVCSSLLLLCTL